MSIASLVTRGFSNGSFIGSISELVIMGYDIGDEASIWTDKQNSSTPWGDKLPVDTSWGFNAKASTIWTDKQ